MHTLIKRSAGILLTSSLLLSSGLAQAQQIFACEPEWAALARGLLPEARIYSATHEHQDPHHIEARPALIAQFRNAELAICSGATLEAGWLPMLQQRAANPALQDQGKAMFYAASHVKLLQIHSGLVSPFDGDVHQAGNPHLHTDPRRLIQVMQALSKQMQSLWPDKANAIQQRQLAIQQTWQTRISQWQQRAQVLQGQKVVVQHASFHYLLEWLGLQAVLDLEPKPGMAPSLSHLQTLLTGVKQQQAFAIVLASYQDQRPARWLQSQTGGRIALLSWPATVSPQAGIADLENWYEQLISQLILAASEQKP